MDLWAVSEIFLRGWGRPDWNCIKTDKWYNSLYLFFFVVENLGVCLFVLLLQLWVSVYVCIQIPPFVCDIYNETFKFFVQSKFSNNRHLAEHGVNEDHTTSRLFLFTGLNVLHYMACILFIIKHKLFMHTCEQKCIKTHLSG